MPKDKQENIDCNDPTWYYTRCKGGSNQMNNEQIIKDTIEWLKINIEWRLALQDRIPREMIDVGLKKAFILKDQQWRRFDHQDCIQREQIAEEVDDYSSKKEPKWVGNNDRTFVRMYKEDWEELKTRLLQEVKAVSEADVKAKQTRVKCIYCHQPIHISKFGGIKKDGLFCNEFLCLLALIREREEAEARKDPEILEKLNELADRANKEAERVIENNKRLLKEMR